MSLSPEGVSVPAWQFDLLVEAEADGTATAEQLAVLDADRLAWGAALQRLLRAAEEFVVTARSLQGDERDQVLADAQSDRRALSAAWDRFRRGERDGARGTEAGDADLGAQRRDAATPGVVRLQVSWSPGRVVAWAAGPGTAPADGESLMALLGAAGAPTAGWVRHAAIPLPGGGAADACAAPIGAVLGWLVAVGAGQVGDGVGASVRWLGSVAVWAVELTARGAMVPLLRQRKRQQRRREPCQWVVRGSLDAGTDRPRSAEGTSRRNAGQRPRGGRERRCPRADPLGPLGDGQRDLS